MAFYCRADAKNRHTEKTMSAYAQTHFLLELELELCHLHIPAVYSGLALCGGGGNGGSFQVNGFQINWQDLRGSEIILRHCNGVGLSRTLICLGLRDNCLLLEQNTISEE